MVGFNLSNNHDFIHDWDFRSMANQFHQPHGGAILPNCERAESIVDAGTYSSLVVSHRRLVRFQEPKTGRLGLRDLETGECFIVEAHTLAGFGLANLDPS